jgi:peptidyl-prolyl cis-trans isomerase SurA
MLKSHPLLELGKILVFSLLLGFGGMGQAEEWVDGIVAVVNDDIITHSDVMELIWRQELNYRKVYRDDAETFQKEVQKLREDARNQLIERQLIIQQFNERGGKVPENIIEDEIQVRIDELYGKDRSLLIKTLEASGTNLEAYKERIRDEVIVDHMRRLEVGSEVIISPYKIEKYYRENLDEFKEGEKVKLRIIKISKGSTEEENKSARDTAQELLLKLTTGSEFAVMAEVYSDGAEKKKGGDLGLIGRDELRKELADVAFSLNPGQISKVIETSEDFCILQVEDKKPSKVTTLEEARQLIERLLIKEEMTKLQKKWIQSLRRKAYIRLY